jgi:hypothetical protein
MKLRGRQFHQPRAEAVVLQQTARSDRFALKRRSGGMADAADSKSVGRKPVKVRLLSPAPPPAPFDPISSLDDPVAYGVAH